MNALMVVFVAVVATVAYDWPAGVYVLVGGFSGGVQGWRWAPALDEAVAPRPKR